MSRTIRYILTVILIIAAALWVLTVYRSCEKAKENKTEVTTNGTGAEDTNTAIVDAADDAGLEDLYEDEEEDSGSADVSENTGDGKATAASDYGKEEEDTSAGEEDVATRAGADDTAFDNKTGDYLVVAGAFVAKSNAEKYQKQLIKKGYDAELRIFIGSDYHSVILGDYATEREALAVAKKIGGEAYVHKRRPLKKRK